MEKRLKKLLIEERGITLVALIITVILMLILAGVAISAVIDSEGLFGKTREATKSYENSAQDENKTISNLMNYIERYTNKNFEEDETNITEEESIAIEEFSLKADTSINSLKINGSATAKGSTILGYQYKINGGEWLPKNPTTKTEYIFNNLTEDTIYTVSMRAIDSEGNVKEATNKDYKIATAVTVNTPKLGTGMTAIKWDETENEWIETNITDEWWYSYKTQEGTTSNTTSKWANAKTTDGSMWVWVPRYAYSITEGYHTATAGKIEVKFMNSNSYTAFDGTACGDSTTAPTYEDNIQQNYIVHPAFRGTSDATIGSWKTELEGIWVAKFEASNNGSNVVQSKPGVDSWHSITPTQMYSYAYSYNTAWNSHMIKNSEWGAMAYLTYSEYGRNRIQITANTTQYTGGSYGADNYYTGTYVEQSTTGNVYGIYDMRGGKAEYTASYVYDTGAGVTNISEGPDYLKQHYDSYNTKYFGDAMYEISSQGGTAGSSNQEYGWFNSDSRVINYSNSCFFRGGMYNIISGMFAFANAGATGFSNATFRVTLCIESRGHLKLVSK